MGGFGVIISKKSVSVLGISAICLFSSLSFAGGTFFPIQINDIHTVSKKEHIIYFKMLENDNTKNFPYPLESCEQVTLKIEYKEWEWDDKLGLFFENLFTLNSGTRRLNRTISQLKEHVKNNQKFILSDVEAFQYHPNNQCEIFSKALDMEDTLTISFVENQSKEPMIFLQPYRNSSRIESRFKI